MTILNWDEKITFFLYQEIGFDFGINTSILFVASSFFIYFVPAVLIYLFLKSSADRLAATKIFLATLLAWQVVSNLLGSWLYSSFGFRTRPFVEKGYLEFMLEQPEKAFPSDHATVMAVVGFGFLLYRYPKLAWFFLLGGLLSSLARVVIGFHWFGDIIGGWIIGLTIITIFYLFNSYLDKIIKPILSKIEGWCKCLQKSKESLPS